jgi:hypothetical protein
MNRMTIAEVHEAFRAQGVDQNDNAVICPICGTIQSMNSLVRAGADSDKVHRFIGFSCEGRFSNAGPWVGEKDKSKKARDRRTVRGCDWTLGGLFKLNRLTITYPDGTEAPSFEIATPQQAQELCASLCREST